MLTMNGGSMNLHRRLGLFVSGEIALCVSLKLCPGIPFGMVLAITALLLVLAADYALQDGAVFDTEEEKKDAEARRQRSLWIHSYPSHGEK